MMKVNIKIICALCLLGGICAPAFSKDYAPVFSHVMKVQPAQATIRQLQEFYQRYLGNEEKPQLLMQMASWKNIPLYKDGMPAVEFLDFALTMENHLPAEDASILVPFYKDTLDMKNGNADYKTWAQQVEEKLGGKTVRVGQFNVRASWVARGAVFQAVLQQGAGKDVNPIAAVDVIEGFAVKSALFGANNAVRKQLMRNLLRRATQVVAQGEPAVVCTASFRCSEEKEIAGAGSKENLERLFRLEKMVKTAGGEGLDPADPSWKKIQAGRTTLTMQALRQHLKVMAEEGTIFGLGVHTQVR